VFGLSFVLSFGLAGAAAGAVVGWLALGSIGAVTYSLAGAVVAGLLFPPTNSVVYGLAVGLLFGLAVGSLFVLSKTWGAFVFSRAWLALRGHQPGRLMRFLEDARRRGVLRQAGGVYQFRHARLQDYLIKPGKVHHVSTKRQSLRTTSTKAAPPSISDPTPTMMAPADHHRGYLPRRHFTSGNTRRGKW
jgi:hypothetical protein